MILINKIEMNMKNLKRIYSLSLAIVSSVIFSFVSSCSNDDDISSSSSAIPEITKVFEAGDVDFTPVDLGYPNKTYVIQGSGLSGVNKIYFNGVDTYFNQTFVTDNNVFVTIDLDTPYAGDEITNELKIVSANGKEAKLPFVIAPPAPLIIKGFNPINAVEGEDITIYGDFFLNPEVTIGDVEVPVISSTLTEIVIKAPANIEDEKITVTTISGEVVSTQAIGSALYDDELRGDAGHWTWDGSAIVTDYSEDSTQGVNSMKFELGGWSGADFKFNSRDVSKYKAFRLRVKSLTDNAGASVNLVFGGWAYQIPTAMTSAWTYVEVPFSEIGNPTTFDQLTIQESGNFGGNSFLFDDMGFVLK